MPLCKNMGLNQVWTWTEPEPTFRFRVQKIVSKNWTELNFDTTIQERSVEQILQSEMVHTFHDLNNLILLCLLPPSPGGCVALSCQGCWLFWPPLLSDHNQSLCNSFPAFFRCLQRGMKGGSPPLIGMDWAGGHNSKLAAPHTAWVQPLQLQSSGPPPTIWEGGCYSSIPPEKSGSGMSRIPLYFLICWGWGTKHLGFARGSSPCTAWGCGCGWCAAAYCITSPL